MNKLKVILWGLIIFSQTLCFYGFYEGDESHDSDLFFVPQKWDIPYELVADVSSFAEALESLQRQRVEIRFRRINTTMNVRPTIGSLVFRNKENRKYIIRINNDKDFKGVLYQDIPQEARAGLWVHEFMHIEDFKNRSFFGVLERGWQYLSVRGKIRFENEIDQMVMNSGFGYELFLWTSYILNESTASESYKEFKKKIYLSPTNIYRELDEGGFLEDPSPVI